MKSFSLRKASWIASLLLTVVVIVVAVRWLGEGWFSSPDYTLFVHTADASRDPTRVIASVHASRASAWSAYRERPDSAEKLLWVEKVGGTGSQRLFGSHSVNGSELTFTPASPLIHGSMYHIVFVPPGQGAQSDAGFRTGFISVSGKGRLELIHQIPEPAAVEPPSVQSIHPGTEDIPANHLKFYITFSEPMEQGVFMERIKLRRPDGSEIAGPFRETELWSPDGKRLTVWLHPGRQKTGVNLNEDEGAVLRENEDVTLVISGDWRAASGRKLGSEFKRTYRVAKPDHDQPDPEKWVVHSPKPGTSDPLRIEFPEPLDWALLQNSLSVTTSGDGVIEGRIETGNGEREWRFIPKSAWSHGEFRIKVSPVLEDLAGNNLERPFEVDVADARPPTSANGAQLAFKIE